MAIIAVCYALVAICAMIVFYIVVSLGKMWSTVTMHDKIMCVVGGLLWPCVVIGFVVSTGWNALTGSNR
jgi:hypothetical protein